jgi:hypothetical protein
MKDIASEVYYSSSKVGIPFKGKTIRDALNFGFSYIEHEDHIVQYVVANPNIMKKIFVEMPDSILNIDDKAIGKLWTAKLLMSDKLSNDQILLSNNIFSAVINLNLNQET